MTQIRIDLDDDEDRKVELYKAWNRLSSKEEAIKDMIKTYPLVMGERDLYDPIGKWFVENKGCQANEFSKGYVTNEKLGGNYTPNITAIRYELTTNETPSIDFYGYVVEVKLNEEEIVKDLGKIRLYMKKSKNGEWLAGGFTYVSFYIAFVSEGLVDQSLLEICKEDGIGVLQISLLGGRVNRIYEINKPEQIPLGGLSHRSQQSPGTFEEAVKNSYLSKLLIDSTGMYSSLIKPKKELYSEKIMFNKNIENVKDKKAKDALLLVIKRLEQLNFKMEVKNDEIIYINGDNELKIKPKSAWFYIETSWDNVTYRVHSAENILKGYIGGELTESVPNLDDLLKKIVSKGAENA